MLLCNECNKPVRFIAVDKNKIIKCDNVLLDFVVPQGHIKKGYLPHICKVKNNDK